MEAGLEPAPSRSRAGRSAADLLHAMVGIITDHKVRNRLIVLRLHLAGRWRCVADPRALMIAKEITFVSRQEAGHSDHPGLGSRQDGQRSLAFDSARADAPAVHRRYGVASEVRDA